MHYSTIATFADDTALLASNKCPIKASKILHNSINTAKEWLEKWRVAVNVAKSVHVIFTLRKKNCTPVTLNGIQLIHQDCKVFGRAFGS